MKTSVILPVSLFIGLFFVLGYRFERHEFAALAISFIGLFIAYYFVCFSKIKLSLRHGLLLALIARLILIPAYPTLSDDVYRFLWDGLQTINGQSPFAFRPNKLAAQLPPYLTHALYDSLNSKSYYSVYPPISQLIFAMCAYLSGGHIIGFTILIKIFILCAEGGIAYYSLKLLDTLNISRQRVLLYALNPLVIIEGIGNLHFEIFMGFFVMVGLYFLTQHKWLKLIVFIAASIAVKMVSAILWPFLIPWMGFKKWLLFSFILGIFLVIFFIPLWDIEYFQHFITSLDLYFRSFEFNASFYYLMRSVGTWIKGYNPIAIIGPMLSVVSASAIIWLAILNRHKSLSINLSLFTLAFTIYLLCATTVHPWYLILPILLATFVNFRYLLIWSGLIWLSYHAYGVENVNESTAVLIIEYVSLAMAIYLDRSNIRAVADRSNAMK